jgi:hypothetical protein
MLLRETGVEISPERVERLRTSRLIPGIVIWCALCPAHANFSNTWCKIRIPASDRVDFFGIEIAADFLDFFSASFVEPEHGRSKRGTLDVDWDKCFPLKLFVPVVLESIPITRSLFIRAGIKEVRLIR